MTSPPPVTFDPFSEEYFSNPYDTYRRMREEAPVYYNPQYDFYALTRHADVAAALKDTDTYSSAKGVTLDQILLGEDPGASIITMDPPEHRRMRSLVNKVFTPRAIRKLDPLIRKTVRHYLSRVNPAMGFDIIGDFSGLFPVEVITTMLGVPESDRQHVRLWLDTSLERRAGKLGMSRAGIEAMRNTGMLYYQLIQQRRAQPCDDMITALTTVEVEREAGSRTSLTDIEIAAFCTLLGGAGAETVTKLIGNAIVQLSRHPDQWHHLQTDRASIPAAVEEALRFEAPAQYAVRYTHKPVRLHDVTIPAAKPVLLIEASANRDERAFTNADSFDIHRDRGEAQNLGFGYGVHSCLGAALARAESAIALEYLLDLFDDYDVDYARLTRVRMTSVAGWASVPVRARP
ncbi:cytochrome P450 [Mycobacterium sp. 852002-51057_SCH5723018]|uniref:cytochrome P450 n=1 Tax=Mycobacterium sp. 852002-51057_SCH5723018 TaxID=1834094 RepID=UPI0008016569|nr:cytochrome P450 [Mycobacterium sp. 852002-51057_SCH5723018]OBG30262.1 cytochrome [Mycobacterium sp. 852002-51057_SCH5723018]